MAYRPPGRARGKREIRRTNYQGTALSYYRTPEHRKLRAALIRQWKPWEKSTGPKSTEGKAKVVQNAYRGATRKWLRELRRALHEQEKARQRMME